MSLPLSHFEDMFAQSDDPWSFRSRFYEARKRALTLAALDRPRFRRLFEPGCANGELTAALARRCDALVASDGVEAAVTLARSRVSAFPHVRVERGVVPEDWPQGTFDCIVLSELGYFLSPLKLEHTLARATASLDDDGLLVLCHWRRPIAGCELTGDDVHSALRARTTLFALSTHVEEDFLLDVWAKRSDSVGTREGLH